MISLTTADNALKTLYLGVIAEQLNTNVNPLLSKIEQTSSDVWGKNVVKLAQYGVNGGVGAGTETGDLPSAGGNNYAQLTATLKNLYGSIEITDKAIRASSNNAGAFVNLLNAEMEGLLKASKFNLSRMLYGNSSGILANTVTNTGTNKSVLCLDSVKNVFEGMIVDVYDETDPVVAYAARRITAVDRANKTITISGTIGSVINDGYFITVQNSYEQELTGLGSIFATTGNLYGLAKSSNYWLNPQSKTLSSALTLEDMQEVIDNVEEISGSNIDFIVSSYDAKRAYIGIMNTNRRNIDTMTLDGGFKALSYNGIPIVADRFVPDKTMYFLDTSAFKLHQLCDWRWLEGDSGQILHQQSKKASYNATLVKYAELVCDRPIGQTVIKNIT